MENQKSQNCIRKVIFQVDNSEHYQYCVLYWIGKFSRMKPNVETKKAVKDALNGYDPSGGATFFWNPTKVGRHTFLDKRPKTTKIKDHQFAR
ncbi:cell wall hydrolase [Peribacillus butanolivorans]|uniref:cell wall hydrolase n=1 Tax=Peribacillus butanolivorans TaxID=421767 RepID=UPI0036495E14